MRQRTRWKLHEVLKAIGLAERIWRNQENANWSEKYRGLKESQEWLAKKQKAIEELREMGLGELVLAVIKMQ